MMEEDSATKPGFAESFTRKYQYVLDKSSPHTVYRWILFFVFFLGYCVRVYYLNGWFIISYGLGIYLLNQFIGFITPQVRNTLCGGSFWKVLFTFHMIMLFLLSIV